MNKFFETLPDNDDQCLEKLKVWLEKKECVKGVEIICRSCIETFPATSEMRVEFISKKKTVALTMDIGMAVKARFRRYHNYE